jgi:AraC-like DNA-binding protein
VLSGKGIHRVGAEEHEVGEGDVFIINGDLDHGYRETRGLHIINILFQMGPLRIPLRDVRALPGYHLLFDIEPRSRKSRRFRAHLLLEIEELGQVALLAARLEQELRDQRPGYRFVALGRFMDIIGFLCRAYSRERGPHSRPLLRVGEVAAWLEENYRESVGVAALAKVAHLSERSLLREFQRAVGHSPIEYLIRLRLRKAVEALQSSGDNVTRIAFDCGFQDSNYFSRQFRKTMGVSPSEFRRLPRDEQNLIIRQARKNPASGP